MAFRKTLDPKLDIVFWMLFGAERNRALLISLLNAVLRPPTAIESAEVLHAQPEKVSVDDKSIALDVRVRLASGEQVDVEMQSQRRPALRERALYYWARLYAAQLRRGDEYTDLRRCAVIVIATFEELEQPRFHSIFRAHEWHTGELLSEHMEVHLVELPRLSDVLGTNDEPGLVQWAKFLCANGDQELETLAMQDPVLKQAKDALDSLSADPEARVRAEQREMALISYELDLTAARKHGLAIGKAEGLAVGKAEGLAVGKAEGKAEVLRELLASKFGPLSSELKGRVDAAAEGDLDQWVKRLLVAKTVEDVFA